MFDRRVARGSTFASVPTLVSTSLIFRSEKSVFFREIRIYLDRWGTIDSSEASGSETKTFGEETCSSASVQSACRQNGFATSGSWKKTRTSANWDLSRGGKLKSLSVFILINYYFKASLDILYHFCISYIFKLTEKPDESEVATQTDYFLEKPVLPNYYTGKVGQDACTQIEPGEVRVLILL